MLKITKTEKSTLHAGKTGPKIPPWALAVLGCVIVSVLANFFVVFPQWQRVGPGRELDVAAAQAEMDGRERYLDQLKALLKNYQSIEPSAIDLLSRMLPRGKGAPELLHQIEAIARQSGVTMSSISIVEANDDARKGTAAQRAAAQKKKTDVKQLRIQVQVTAYDYPSFRSFLESLQLHTRILDVEDFSFSTDKDVQQVTMKAYYLE